MSTTVLQSTIDPSAPAFTANREALLERLAELEEALDQARGGGGEKYVTRHHGRGKLLPGSGSSCCSTRTARSSSCRRWPRTAPTSRSAPAP